MEVVSVRTPLENLARYGRKERKTMESQEVISYVSSFLVNAPLLFITIVFSFITIVFSKLFDKFIERVLDAIFKVVFNEDCDTTLERMFTHPVVAKRIRVVVYFFPIFVVACFLYNWIPADFPWKILLILIFVFSAFLFLMEKLGLPHISLEKYLEWIQDVWANHKKGILFIIVAIVVIAIALAPPPPEEPPLKDGPCGQRVKWEFYSDGTLKIIGDGVMDDYSEKNRVPWWEKRDEIQKVEIDSRILKLGNWAFSECRAMERISFSNAESDSSAIQIIGKYAFYHCASLKTINIPQKVQKIEERTFQGCAELKAVTLPGELEAIGYEAFSGCEKLSEITIPETVQCIGESAFERCGLETLKIRMNAVPEEAEKFQKDFHCLESGISSLKSTDFLYNIDNTFPLIGPQAFRGCKSLKTVAFQNSSAVRIGEFAFQGCGKLSEINLPASARRIDKGAFEDCECLERLTIDGGVEKHMFINESAFQNCVRLSAAEIHGGSVTINSKAFYDCESLTTIAFPEMPEKESPDWNGQLTIGFNAFYDCKQLSHFPFPFQKCVIGKSAFQGCAALETVKLSDGMERVEYGVFSGCLELKRVELPQSIEEIGDYAFSQCEALEGDPVATLQNLKSIGKGAFSRCDSLETIEIPDGVQTLGENSFDCGKGLRISVPSQLSGQVYGAVNDSAYIEVRD